MQRPLSDCDTGRPTVVSLNGRFLKRRCPRRIVQKFRWKVLLIRRPPHDDRNSACPRVAGDDWTDPAFALSLWRSWGGSLSLRCRVDRTACRQADGCRTWSGTSKSGCVFSLAQVSDPIVSYLPLAISVVEVATICHLPPLRDHTWRL